MRIAYIAPYQGSGLLERRPTLHNLALAANVKIELISELLLARSHDVEILSQGDVDRRQFKFYPGFREPRPFSASIAVDYVSSVPIKFVKWPWSAWRLLQLFKARHRACPYDVVIIYNLHLAQMVCAYYAVRRLGLPVVLEYEDDALVDIAGKSERGWKSKGYRRLVSTVLRLVSASFAPSPHLLSQVPTSVPKVLLRGVVSDEIMRVATKPTVERKNWIVFSGTFYRTKGLEPLVRAWKMVDLPDWQLHLAGDGEKMASLREMAGGSKSIIFHGVLDRKRNAELLSMSRIGINPHDVSETPGNVFAFKIIEYLAAGTHVITTPMGFLERDLEAGISYMSDNSPEEIAEAIKRVVEQRTYERTAQQAAHESYGPVAVSELLGSLVSAVKRKKSASIRTGDEIEA